MEIARGGGQDRFGQGSLRARVPVDSDVFSELAFFLHSRELQPIHTRKAGSESSGRGPSGSSPLSRIGWSSCREVLWSHNIKCVQLRMSPTSRKPPRCSCLWRGAAYHLLHLLPHATHHGRRRAANPLPQLAQTLAGLGGTGGSGGSLCPAPQNWVSSTLLQKRAKIP